jgi:type II secretory ATPase GspE/PulE/Tfp pilus assembly ATPase PilB-like protein
MSQAQDLAQSNFPVSNTHKLDQKFQPTKTNPARIFELIDGLLPFGYCLSHGIVPLELSENCLTLGAIAPGQDKLLELVRSICGTRIEDFKLHPIDSHTHQLILSAYSKYSRQPKLMKSQQEPLSSPEPPREESAKQHKDLGGVSWTVAIPQQPIQERPTLIIDAPEELPTVADRVDSLTPKPTKPLYGDNQPKPVPSLEVKARYLSAPVEFISALPPYILWQEILGRVLEQGIGRLYFERLAEYGRVLWSQNGALKLSIDSLELETFQSILIELRRFVGLPNTPVVSVQQGELERIYQQEKLLIRWRINPGEYGEEATVQILRGKALELYQSRQIKEWEKQALDLAEKLAQKLKQIREYRQTNPIVSDNLASLPNIQKKIKLQLDLLA